MKNSLLFIVISILIISCAETNYFKNKDELLKLSGRTALPTKEEFPDADAVVLYEKYADDYQDIKNPIRTFYKAKQALRNLAQVSFDAIQLSKGEEIHEIQARVIQPDGTVIPLTENDFDFSNKISQTNYFSLENVIMIKFPNIKENSILEYYCSSEIGEYNRGFNHWYIQIPKEYKIVSQYSLIDKFFDYILFHEDDGLFSIWYYYKRLPQWSSVLKYNDIDTNIQPSSKSYPRGFTESIWTFKNIKPFKSEPLMPPPFDAVPNISYSLLGNQGWDYLTRYYYYEFFLPKLDNQDSVKIITQELLDGASTETEKVQKIYNYVSQMRYEAIPFGKSGIDPLAPLEVIRRQYGDCKDKSTLLVSMLRSIDMHAFPVLALSNDFGEIDTTFPEFKYNHMIVMVLTKDKKEIYIDPTVTHCPINQLPVKLEGTKLCVIDYNGNHEFKSIKHSLSTENRIEYNIDINYDKDLNAVYDIYISFYGEKDLRYRNNIFDMEYEESMKYIKEMLNNSKFDFELQNIEISNFFDVSLPFVIHFNITTDKAATRQGKTVILDHDIFKLDEYDLFKISKDRQYPIYLDYAYSIIKNIRISYDSTKFKISEYPQSTNENNKYIYYRRELGFDKGRIISGESYGVDSPRIPVDAVNSLKEKIDHIQQSLAEKIILTEIK